MRASEVFSLTWSQVNLREGYIRLEPGDTKSGEGRTVYLAGEALQALKAAHSARRRACPLVFHRKGHRIRDYHKTWNEACETQDARDCSSTTYGERPSAIW